MLDTVIVIVILAVAILYFVISQVRKFRRLSTKGGGCGCGCCGSCPFSKSGKDESKNKKNGGCGCGCCGG